MKKIMVVDDNPNLSALLEATLQNVYDLAFASDGEEALKRAMSEKPDLILLDIMLPKMDGFEVLNHLKKDPKTKSIPVVMLSALSHQEERLKAQQYGADGYIAKPFSPHFLLDTVSQFLSGEKEKP